MIYPLDRVYYAGFAPNCKVYRAKRTASRVKSNRYNDGGGYVTEQAKAEAYCKVISSSGRKTQRRRR